MRTATILLLLLGCVMSYAQERRTDLLSDERLQQPITLRYEIIPLNELAAEMTKQTGVSLSVSREIAEDKATLFVRRKPAHEVMNRLADVLQAEWVPVPQTEGYRLTSKASMLSLERAMRTAELEATRKSARESLSKLAAIASQVDYLDLVDAVTRSGENEPGEPSEIAQLVQRLGGREAVSLASRIEHYLTGWVVQHFTEGQWAQLFDSQRIVASNVPSPEAISLPPRVLDWNNRLWGTQPVHEVEVTLQLAEGGDEIWASVVRYEYADGRRIWKGTTRATVWSSSSVGKRAPKLEEQPLARFWNSWSTRSERLSESHALRKKLRTDHQQPSPAEQSDFATWQRRVTAAQCLRWLAEHTELNIVADAYRCVIEAGEFEQTDVPVYRWLRDVLLPNGWVKSEGDWVQFRHWGYWSLRLSEVPERVLRPLERKAAEGKQLELEDYSSLAIQLTQLQARRITSRTGDMFVVNFDDTPLRNSIPALRFWATLTPPQRDRARRGEPLLLPTLSRQQQEAFARAFLYNQPQPTPEPNEPWEDDPPHFRYSYSEREEYVAQRADSLGMFSASSLEGLIDILDRNQQRHEHPRFSRVFYREPIFTFYLRGATVTYRISLRQVQPI